MGSKETLQFVTFLQVYAEAARFLAGAFPIKANGHPEASDHVVVQGRICVAMADPPRTKSRRPQTSAWPSPYFPCSAAGGGPGGTSDAAISETDFQDPSACFLYTSTTLPLSFIGFLVTGSVTIIA